MTSTTAPSYSKNDHPRSTSDASRLIAREGRIKTSHDEMQRRWNRITLLRKLEREAREQRATLVEILDPGFTVALPSSGFTSTIGHFKVRDGTVIDAKIPIEHTSNITSAGGVEAESEEVASDTELLSPRSTDSGASVSSSQISNLDDIVASLLKDSEPDSPLSTDSRRSSSSSQISNLEDTVASLLEEGKPKSPRDDVANIGEITDVQGEKESESADLQHGNDRLSSQAAGPDTNDLRSIEDITADTSANEFPSTPLIATPLAAACVAPTSTHLAAAASLSPDERIRFINEFLQQNVNRLDAFRTRETVENPAWQNRSELEFLTDAVLWIDALLSFFRTGIINEDITMLKPRLDEASRYLDVAMRAQTGKRERKEREGTELPVSRELYDRVIEIQHSNSARNQLLQETSFDAELFANLLLAAESVRFRIESNGGTSSWAALVAGMRRIYSTIVCTVPFGWIKAGKCIFKRVPVRNGMLSFDLSLLPQPTSIIPPVPTSRVGMDGQIPSIVEGSEALKPFSKEFWRSMKKGELPNVGSPQQSQVGETGWKSNTNSAMGSATPNYLVNGDNVDGGNEEDTAAGSASLQSSPDLSDCSDISDLSDKLFPQGLDVLVQTSKGPFCLLVNTAAGCQDRDNCGYKAHVNEGKVCKEGEYCRRGSRCAFVHGSLTTTDPASRRSSDSPMESRTRDLRPILEQVLKNVEQYNVCVFVNKYYGCKAENEGRQCRFNHTLKGIICPEYQQDQECPREFRCPLMHVDEYFPAVKQPHQTFRQLDQTPVQMPVPQPAAQKEDATTKLRRFFLRTGQSMENFPPLDQDTAQQVFPAGETISTQPPTPVQWQDQTLHADGPPANAPRGPRQQEGQSWPNFREGKEESDGRGLSIKGFASLFTQPLGHSKRKQRELVDESRESDADDECRKQRKRGGEKG